MCIRILSIGCGPGNPLKQMKELSKIPFTCHFSVSHDGSHHSDTGQDFVTISIAFGKEQRTNEH